MLPAVYGLKVGLHWGPTPFHLEACLPPATIHHVIQGSQAVHANGLLPACTELASVPLSLPFMFISAHSPEGTKVTGGWHVNSRPSTCTPGWTAPSLGLNFALKLEHAPGLGKSPGSGRRHF